MDHHRDVPVTGTTNPGGGREENPPEIIDPLTDPSHAANPIDGAPSPGPQPGSTVPHDDHDHHGHDHAHDHDHDRGAHRGEGHLG
ncbi:hypothetical protein [Actinotalea sp. Marseille-Q4924]|uniref:hypothetical protein n=1 Tax=Actinotalea sp. Marseille-Q4924 TaxID=2866571 RepID=UPI001CE44F19|nr:hypothetical protein [Actinotalea sp. Marseille-Q4924]